jgi:2-polyprenyl-6-methoxyphenol hydroxylase-like FAD-dependent oxidoreductase
MLLARQGLRVLVVDPTSHGSDTLSTHALMRGGVLQLHRWGVLDAIRSAGTPAIRTTTFHYAGLCRPAGRDGVGQTSQLSASSAGFGQPSVGAAHGTYSVEKDVVEPLTGRFDSFQGPGGADRSCPALGLLALHYTASLFDPR